MANFASKFGLRIPHRSSGPSTFGFGNEMRRAIGLGNQDLSETEQDYLSRRQSRRRRGYGAEAPEQGGLTQKNIMDYQQKEADREFNKEKEFVGRWTDLVLKAREVGDTALQKHLLSYGRDYIETLSYGTRQLLEPLLRAGPFDPMKAKMDKFDQFNPAPQITADREKQPLLHAQEMFAAEDWQAERTHFATGKAGPKRNLLPVDGENGLYAMRDDKGRVSIVNETSLQIKEFAKKHEVTEGSVLATGGAPGKEQTVKMNGKVTKVRPFTDFTTGETILETLPGMSPEQFQKHEKDVAEFMSILNADDEKLIKKHPMASLVKRAEEQGKTFEEIAPLLKQAYGYNFIKPKEEANIFSHLYDVIKPGEHVKGNALPFYGGYVEGDNGTIRVVPGEEMNLKGFRVFYDQDSDSVFNATDGIRLGSYDETLRKIEERSMLVTERKKKKEEEEDELSRRKSIVDVYSSGSF